MTYRTPCHARDHGFFHHRHVPYRTPCRASGHLGHLVILLVSGPLWGRQFNPNVSRANFNNIDKLCKINNDLDKYMNRLKRELGSVKTILKMVSTNQNDSHQTLTKLLN